MLPAGFRDANVAVGFLQHYQADPSRSTSPLTARCSGSLPFAGGERCWLVWWLNSPTQLLKMMRKNSNWKSSPKVGYFFNMWNHQPPNLLWTLRSYEISIRFRHREKCWALASVFQTWVRWNESPQLQWKPYTQLAVTIIADNNFQPDNPQDTDRIFFWMIRVFWFINSWP